MMEGLNMLGQEEYIWAMKECSHRDETEAQKARESKYSAHVQLLIKKSKYSMGVENQTKVVASLVPDEVIYHINDYRRKKYDACFLFGDVSGFTELCEKYSTMGTSGTSRMTQTLNKYLGSMVQEVLCHDGDILKFSGDAFIASFKCTESESMRDAVHGAMDCALVIQKNYGSYLTDMGVVIRVKLAISAGPAVFGLIGNKNNTHYVVVGQPIREVKAAEHISTAGDIMVTTAAYKHVNANEYIVEAIGDNIHVKLIGVGHNWRSIQKNIHQQRVDQAQDYFSLGSDSSDSDSLSETQEIDEYTLRPAVNTAVQQKMKEALKRYIIAPVMKTITMNEPLEFLCEMRQATTVFINVVSYPLPDEKTVILANETYTAVCSVVEKKNGCVNKVSFFDKDMMLVVIFGLRGFKHELECQMALRCARECHTAISHLPGVASTSIGVTTGKTYCGVFGHTLRREYTVIGLIVNKAARLMMAYKNKVTCDKATFLHSKLEANNFILQDYVPLKGISRPGPVYEFVEADIDHDVIQKIDACPLLGRNDELKLYHMMFEAWKTGTNQGRYKMLLVKSESRQGKTRLLDEFVYTTPDKTSVYKITLTRKDNNRPYRAIELIFRFPLNLTKESTTKDKEGKILKKLQALKVNDVLCALNDVFGVNFKKSEFYMSLNAGDKLSALRKLITTLARACFSKMWILAIDDCEFIDIWSCSIFNALFEVEKLFIVGTMIIDTFDVSAPVKRVMKDTRIKEIILKPIRRLYLAAIACHILDVYGISPELENVIQTRSNGSPGWIESYLICSHQDKSLKIVKATLLEVHKLGLVCPPLYMMARLTKEEAHMWQTVMEERTLPAGYTGQVDHWERYIDSCRDAYLNIVVRGRMEAIDKDGKLPVCVISETFSVSDNDNELSLDAIILKTFDSLSYYEQLLVKCGAILGNQFFRTMLFYVMSAEDKRKFALAVQKLFDIKVLTCAKGDFYEEGTGVFSQRLLNPALELQPACHCRGLIIPNVCMDLPKYASCGYLQFRSSMFRNITYNLLTDNQKKEFHHRAMNYLERETNKCNSCGGRYFENIFGAKHDKELVAIRINEKKLEAATRWHGSTTETISTERSSVHSGSISEISTGSGRFSRKKSAMSERSRASSVDIKSIAVSEQAFGMSMMKRLRDSYSLTRTFSREDFTDCRCNLILSTTYAQLIEHCNGAGELYKLIEALLEYSRINIISTNFPLALKSLNEALDALQRIEAADTVKENVWKLSLISAKIYSLAGFCLLEMGYLDQAEVELRKALSKYEITFPRGVHRQMKVFHYKVKHYIGFHFFPRLLMKPLDYWGTLYSNNLSECLSHLCIVFVYKKKWRRAEMAATWSLTRALGSFSDFRVICTACANMIRVAQHYANWKLCLHLEMYSLQMCRLKASAVDVEDLRSVAQLYGVIFSSRIKQMHMERAIHMGYIVLRICSSIRAHKIILPLLPHLVRVLMKGKHFSNLYGVLKDMYDFSEMDIDISGKIWYYDECLCLHIETGYTLLTYCNCEHFYKMESESWVGVRDPDAKKRFFAVMWLWCLRNEQWEEALIWSEEVDDFTSITLEDTLSNKFSAMYVLEGLLLYLVYKVDRHNTVSLYRVWAHIDKLIKALEKASKTAEIMLPRLYHLKAYYSFITTNKVETVHKLLDTATSYAQKHKDLLEEEWIEHSKKAWNNQLPAAVVDFWKDHSDPDNLAPFDDIAMNQKIGFFTLPTPQYM
ncbi:hypothetical protein Zmor_020070 [Zophobas morio]|uniref:Guanylate cyclase domain-containing protein n=1 Tax=Zophobas morio TaxID=2755281 RepID=A0AA38I687_9CUCU|nr:hypothetical protein Zmor_020070 [Zophobas morio]